MATFSRYSKRIFLQFLIMRILLIGHTGQIGFDLKSVLSKEHDLTLLDRNHLNLENHKEIYSILTQNQKIDLMINAAAFTNVNLAEKEKDKAFLVNAYAAREIARAAKDLNAYFIHYSTDYVFDGQSCAPYSEKDKTNPLNIYGESKLFGEELIKKQNGKNIILRTSFIFSERRSNFLLTLLKLSQEKKELFVVNDLISNPTGSYDIALATSKLIQNISQPSFQYSPETHNLLHMTNQGAATRYEFATKIFKLLNKDILIHKVESSFFPNAVPRPQFSALSNQKLKEVFSITLPHWEESLQRVLSNTLTK